MEFSKSWKSSKNPDKQRKYVYNAPLNIRGNMMVSPLSKDLRQKYGTRSVRIRTGDKIKFTRGQFKGKEGKVERVDVSRYRVHIDTAQVVRKDGTKSSYPVHPSNVMIIELNLSDKRRFKATAPEKKPVKKAVAEKTA